MSSNLAGAVLPATLCLASLHLFNHARTTSTAPKTGPSMVLGS